MLFGLWVIIYQFLGFPASWIKILGVVTGAFICFVAYRLNSDVSMEGKDDRMTYVEHKNTSDVRRPGAGDITNTKL